MNAIATKRDMSEADKVIKYCHENHINKDMIDDLFARGYTKRQHSNSWTQVTLSHPKSQKGNLFKQIAKGLSNNRFSTVEPTSAPASGLPIIQQAAPGLHSTQIE